MQQPRARESDEVGVQAGADFSEARGRRGTEKIVCHSAQHPHGDRGSHLQLALLRGLEGSFDMSDELACPRSTKTQTLTKVAAECFGADIELLIVVVWTTIGVWALPDGASHPTKLVVRALAAHVAERQQTGQDRCAASRGRFVQQQWSHRLPAPSSSPSLPDRRSCQS